MCEEVVYANTNENSDNTVSQEDLNEGEYLRLTDLEFRSESKTGWGQIRKNMDSDGNKLQIKREGAYYPFDNGICSHETSEVYFNL